MAGQGFGRASEIPQRDAAIVQRRGVRGLDGQGQVIARHSLCEAAQTDQHIAAAEQGRGGSGVQLERLVVGRQGLAGIASGIEHGAQVCQGVDIPGPHGQRRADQAPRLA